MNLIEIILYWGKLYLPNAISNSDTLEFSNILFIVKHPSYKWAALCRRDKAYDSVRPFTHCILKSDPWKNPLLGQCIHDKINYTKLWLRRLFCGFFHEWNERNLKKIDTVFEVYLQFSSIPFACFELIGSWIWHL